MNEWRALENKVINFQVPLRQKISCLAERLLVSQGGLYRVQLATGIINTIQGQ
jgi:hypothetical protein